MVTRMGTRMENHTESRMESRKVKEVVVLKRHTASRRVDNRLETTW